MVLARSATIAIRVRFSFLFPLSDRNSYVIFSQYCAVRRQFADRDAPVMDGNKPAETQVLNYQMVQARIFPPLVQAFACHYSAFISLLSPELANPCPFQPVARCSASTSRTRLRWRRATSPSLRTCTPRPLDSSLSAPSWLRERLRSAVVPAEDTVTPSLEASRASTPITCLRSLGASSFRPRVGVS